MSMAAWGLTLGLLTLSAQTALAQGLTYEGTLTDLNDEALNETLTMRFALYTQAQGGDLFWEETRQVPVEDGDFNVVLGQMVPLPSDPPTGLFLEVVVAGDVQAPRTPVTGALYAARASVADDVPGRDISPRSVSIEGYGPVIDAEGRWLGRVSALDSDGDGFSDIVEITLGADPDDSGDRPLDDDMDGVADALQGVAGRDGTSCTVTQNGSGAIVSCEDGTEAIIQGGGAARWRFVGLAAVSLAPGEGVVTLNNACLDSHTGSRMCTSLEFVRTVSPPEFEGNALVATVPVSNSDGAYILDATGVYVRREQVAEIQNNGVLLINPTNQPRPPACCVP